VTHLEFETCKQAASVDTDRFLYVCMSQRICDGCRYAVHSSPQLQEANDRKVYALRLTVCRRPKRVCLCAAYPASPKATSGLVFILQHPLEHR